MDFNTPFLNATTIGTLTTELTIPLIWDSIIRTITTFVLVSLVSQLITFIHLARSNAAAAQIVAVDGHRGGSLHAVWELIRNRRRGALRHYYPRRWLLSLLFVLSVLLFHASNFIISAYIQQKGDETVVISELPVKLWRVSTRETEADFGCINKHLTYRNGQSDLAVGLCNFFPTPTVYNRSCMGLVRREADGHYGMYHPHMIAFTEFSSPGITFIGPMVVSGNTFLLTGGILPILEVEITEDLLRNMFSDMVEGNITVRPLRFSEISGIQVEGLGLCGNINVTSRIAVNKLVGGLGFVEGKSRILDAQGNPITMEVKTSASRTSIRTVIIIGVSGLAGFLLSILVRKLWKRVSGTPTNITGILTTAVSQAGGTDCAMPAAVANGDVSLVQVNTLDDGTLLLGIYPANNKPEAVKGNEKQVKDLLRQAEKERTYQGSKQRTKAG